MFVSSWPGWVTGTELDKAPRCWLGSAAERYWIWRASVAKWRNLRKAVKALRAQVVFLVVLWFLINHTQRPNLFFRAFSGCARLFTFSKHRPQQEQMLFGRGAPWEVDTTSCLVALNAWISQICLSLLLVIEEQLQRCIQPPKRTYPCLQVSGARHTAEPSILGAGLSDKAGVSYLPEAHGEVWRWLWLHLYIPHPIIMVMNYSRGAVGWLGGVETEPQGTELWGRVGCTVRAMAGGHCSGVASQHHPYNIHLYFKILE